MGQVIAQAIEQDRRQLDLADDRVAAPAQEATDVTRGVAVVHDEVAILGVAQEAPVALFAPEARYLSGRESVLAHEARTQVLGSGSVGVLAPPVPEALVSPGPVRLPVLAIPAADAGATLASPAAPLREIRIGSLLATSPALHGGKRSAVAWRGRDLDQPCHADVLLEVANRDEP